MPMGPMMLDATAMEPATLLVSAQMNPMMVPTTKTATITASQYRIRRLLMVPGYSDETPFPMRIEERELEAGGPN